MVSISSSWKVVAHFLLTFVGLSAAFTLAAGDGRAAARDLPQDYVAARAFLDGADPYQPLDSLYSRYGFPPRAPDVMVRSNPHPPAGILLAVPFALFDYESAVHLFVWSQLVALALTWVLAYELFRPRVSGWIWSLAGGVFGLWAPLWQGVAWAQPVGFLALAVLGVWWLAGSGRCVCFGLLLGSIVDVRPFVAMLAAAAAGWPVPRLARAIAGAIFAASLPFIALGITPLAWYRVASDASGYIAACGSIPGVLDLGAIGGLVAFFVAFAVLAGLRRYWLGIDATLALGAVVALLIYPLAWFQYDTALLPVVAWVVARVAATRRRAALWGLVAYLMLRTLPDLVPTGAEGVLDRLARHKNELQVLARGILLTTVLLVAPRPGSLEDRT